MEREIYFDNSATTRPYDEVIEFINYINKNVYGNPSSLHSKGIEAERLIRNAREIIAKTLGVQREEIYFTSGGTEANNLAILGYLKANPRKGRHVVTTRIEHPSVIEVYKFLSDEGYKVDFLDVDKNGIIDIEGLREKINSDTALVSIIYINNETGTIEPIEEIVKIKNSINKETVLHVDAVQAYGKTRVLPKKEGIDILTISSHKIHGPKGVGALYISKSVKVKPLILGGGQECLVRSGTENVSGICGFGTAADITFKNMDENYEQCKSLKIAFTKKLVSEMDDVVIISPEDSSPYILNVSFRNIRAEVLLHHLEARSIFVSTGAACSSRKNVHSHVLKAMGVKPDIIEGAIRFSFSSFNTLEEVEETIEVLKGVLPKISIKRGGKR
ncbi:MAG: cysteine desulfurase family protein [Bacillota bacterium]